MSDFRLTFHEIAQPRKIRGGHHRLRHLQDGRHTLDRLARASTLSAI